MDPNPLTSGNNLKKQIQKNVRSNLTLQILFFCNIFAVAAIVIVEILIYIYKGVNLPYPPNTLIFEIVLLLLFPAIEAVRLYFGMKGNLTRRIPGVIVALCFTVPACLFSIHLMLWQTYVLRLEFILSIFHVVMLSLEIVFSIVAVIGFARSPDVYS